MEFEAQYLPLRPAGRYDTGEDSGNNVIEVTDLPFYSDGNKFFLGDYQIVKHIATGGEADVFLAYDAALMNRRVAILNIKNLQDAENRINMHRRVNDIDGIVKLFKVIRINKVDCSRVSNVHMNNYHDILLKQSIFLVTGYFEGQDCVSFLKECSFMQQMQFFLKLVDIIDLIHQRQVYHFDLKPDNILMSSSGEFCILDFGAAQMLDEQHLNIVDPLIALYQPTTNIFKFTPKYAPNVPVDLIVAEKFDVFSLGCILYELVIHDYCPGAIYRHSRTIERLNKQFGPLVTDLLAGMLDADQVLRYSIVEVSSHPAFIYGPTNPRRLLEKFHAQITLEIRDDLLYNEDMKPLMRSQSVERCRDILEFIDKNPTLYDDCNRLHVERASRKFEYIERHRLTNWNSGFIAFPLIRRYDLAYYYRLYSDIERCESDSPKNVPLMKFLRFIERIDEISSYLYLFRQMVFDPENAPEDRHYANGSVTNRLSRESTIIREMFRKSESSTDENDCRPSAIEWSIESDGNLREIAERPKVATQPMRFEIQAMASYFPSTAESSDQFGEAIPPPHEAPLDDIFGGYQSIDIEMSTSTVQRTSYHLKMNSQGFNSLKKIAPKK